MATRANKSKPAQTIRRLDSPERVRGAPVYATDIQMPGMLHARVFRSQVPRGRVLSVNADAALQVPGVVAVVTGKDVKGGQLAFPRMRPIPGKGVPPGSDWPSGFQLFPEYVNFVGEGIAAVAAVTPEAAQKAVNLIEAEIEELPAVLKMEDALKPDAPQLYPHGNLMQPPWVYERGDVQKGFDQSDVVMEGTYRTPRQSHAIVEPFCAVAAVQDGLLTVWTVMNSPYEFLQELAVLLGLEEDKLRVVCTAGPTYGGRDNVVPTLEPVAALLSMKTGRPIRLAFTSEEVFQVSRTRHESLVKVKMGLRKDGRVVAMSADATVNGGAYAMLGGRVVESMASKFLGLYSVPNLRYEGKPVRTNTIPAGSYRSVASVQIFFAVETLMNEAARALKIDPVRLRQINHIKSNESLLWGTVVDATPLEQCIAQGAKKFGWGKPKPAPSGEGKAIGRGMAISMHHTGLGNIAREGSGVRAELTDEGRIRIVTSIPDNGQGAQTVLAVIASRALRLPMEAVEMRMGDTLNAPIDYVGAGVNRVTYITGEATKQACNLLRPMLDALAGEAGLPSRADFVSRRRLRRPKAEATAGGGLSSGGVQTVDDLQRLAKWRLSQKEPMPSAEFSYKPLEADPWPTFVAHFAEVEVDTETGYVRVLWYVAAQDVGEAIIPDICDVQTEGGVYHGVGLALREELYVEDGMVTNGNFMEYSAGGIAEFFPVESVLIETEGLPPKGIGTSVAPPVAPAIVAAIADATGFFVHEVPATPERVLRAMGKL